MTRFLFVAIFAFILTWVEGACYKCDGPNCSNIPPVIQPNYPAGDWPEGDVTELADDNPAVAVSPCGRSCMNWKKLGCPEAQPTTMGISCYHVCVKRASLIRIPSACWISAQTVGALRACGGIRCVP